MLISSMLGLAAMVTLQRDPTQASRNAFTRCLFTFADAQANERATMADFEPRLAQACMTEERAYREALRSQQAAMRASAAEIEEIQTMEVEDARANTKSRFEDGITPR